MTFTFSDLVEIFTRLYQDRKISVSGYELACMVVDCWCAMQKQDYVRQTQERWLPSEKKG